MFLISYGEIDIFFSFVGILFFTEEDAFFSKLAALKMMVMPIINNKLLRIKTENLAMVSFRLPFSGDGLSVTVYSVLIKKLLKW